jgi:hypothetical protein
MDKDLLPIIDAGFSAWELCGSINSAVQETARENGVILDAKTESAVFDAIFELIQSARRDAGVI